MVVRLPRLYAILDVSFYLFAPDPLIAMLAFARDLKSAGVTLLQFRNKTGSSREVLSHARALRAELGPDTTFFMNDRADLAVAAGCDGVHLGQDDLSPEGARKVIGDRLWMGLSTHNPEQVRIADEAAPDYIAVGPVFATTTKSNPDPLIGLEGVQEARRLTSRPLVAIGGITLDNCRSVIDAGADSVAVISSLTREPRKSAEQFLRILM
ncbi:MAG TPA: thiamine phosphate synthase [Terriglobales bacterium]|nr:thiamine phosphate synthase [Terriglobales bacterium]